MSTLTAEATGSFTVRVTLTVVTGLTGPLTIYRDSLEGARVPVRGAVGVPGSSSVWDDTEAPLNRPVFYVAVGSDGFEVYSTEPVVLTAPRPILSDPLTNQWVHVTIAAEDERRYPQRAVVLDVEGRRGRIRIYDVEGAPDLPSLRLRTDTGQDLAIARGLFASGKVLLLRGSCPGYEDTWIGLTGQRSEQRITMRVSDARRHHVVEALQEDQPAPETRAIGDTLADLHAAVPSTLADLATMWPGSMIDIAATDLGAI